MKTEPINISRGLKFKSTSFSDSAEVVQVINGKIDVMITSSEGNSRIMKGWDLEQMKARFKKGEYTIIENGPNYSVW